MSKISRPELVNFTKTLKAFHFSVNEVANGKPVIEMTMHFF